MTEKQALKFMLSVLVMAIALLLFYFVYPGDVWGGDHTERIRLTDYGVQVQDSSMIRIFEIGTGNQVGDDSVVTTFPDSFLFTLDSGKVYKVEPYEAWLGQTTWTIQSVWTIDLRLVTATATLDTADKQQIAGLAADSTDAQLTATKGIGPWGPAGGGTYTVSILTADTLGGQTTAVPGVHIEFKDWGLSASHRNVESNESGIAQIGTDEDSLAFRAVYDNPLYVFPTTWDSLAWTSDTTDTIFGYLNVPAAAIAVNYVTAYVDLGAGFIDSVSGAMTPRTKVKIACNLLGGRNITGSTWALVPKTQKKKPDANGRVQFFLPANTVIEPAGSYYELTWEARDGADLLTGTIRKFIVDTLPDPINILEATEVP